MSKFSSQLYIFTWIFLAFCLFGCCCCCCLQCPNKYDFHMIQCENPRLIKKNKCTLALLHQVAMQQHYTKSPPAVSTGRSGVFFTAHIPHRPQLQRFMLISSLSNRQRRHKQIANHDTETRVLLANHNQEAGFVEIQAGIE